MKRLLSLLLIAATPATAQMIAIVHARVATMTGPETIDNGTVLIRDGRIAAVGANLAVPAGATTIDAQGAWVTPGIFAGLSNLGIVEAEGVEPTNDSSADASPFSAAIDIAPGVNPRSVNIPINRLGGVTRAAVAPASGHDVFEGQGAIIALTASNPVMRARAFQRVDLGEHGAKLAGGSRGAAFLNLRSGLHDAMDYARNPAGFQGGREKGSILTRRDAEALVPVVQGRQLLLIDVARAQDILNVLALRREFPALRLVLVGADEGWLVAREIAAASVPVIATALGDLPESFESLAATQSNVGRMVAAGVTVALSGGDGGTSVQPRLLPIDAGNLVAIGRIPGATGLTHAQALATITRAPADIFGVGAQLGSLAPGKIADVVIWSGDPLELASVPTAVFIAGVSQPMVSRQTELRDRYLGLQRGDLTLRYRRSR